MRRLVILTGLLLVLITALLWGGRERFVTNVLRPWAVAKVATALNGEVRLERLELDWGRLDLYGLQVARSGTFRLQVARIAIRYSLAGLWRHRLESVAVQQPELEWHSSGAQASTEPTPWPQQPPLQVAAWNVEAGQLALVLGKERLLLRQIAAAGSLGGRFRVEAAARLGAEPGVALGLTGEGRWEGTPELTLTRLLWAERSLLQAPVTIAPGAKTLEATVSLARLDDTEAARLLAALDRPRPWPAALGWEVAAPRLTIGFDGHHLALRLESAAGEIRHQGRRWPWESLQLQLTGSGEHWETAAAAGLPAQTRIEWTGTLNKRTLRGQWQVAVPAPVALGRAFGFELPGAANALRELTLSGDLQLATGKVASEQIRLTGRWQNGGTISGVLAGSWQEQILGIAASRLALEQAGQPLASAAFALSGQPAQQRWQGNWQLRVADLQGLTATRTAAAPGNLPNLREIEMQGELTGADGTLALPITRLSAKLQGKGLSGQLDGRLTLHRRAPGWRGEIEQLAATALEYTSADGLTGITGGKLQLAGTLDWQQELNFAVHGEATAGEALAGSWYADLGGLPLRLTATGGWAPATNRVRLQTGQLDLAGLITARLQGSHDGTALELTGELAVPKLDGAFQTRLRQLAAGVVPGVEQLTLAGGVTADLAGRWQPEGWSVSAAVQPVAVHLARGETVRLAGLNGTFPLLLQRGTTAPTPDRQATLSWEELRLGPMVSAGGRMRLTAATNRWRLEEPLRLAVGGGWLELTGMTLGLPEQGTEISAAVKATGIELAELSRAFGWPEMGGQLGAEFPEIRLTNDAVSIGGEARLRVFDGEIRTRNLRLDQPFSRYPTYHADIDFAGIDLQLLTRTFAFGEINGVADGFVHDLRLFGAVPSAFRASFATREQGSRNISVKAIRNLNTLSQGGLSAALSQGVYRFIDFYRYRKIGIRCALHNDVFRLEGTAKPGTGTYLIDGGWLPPRIDVIVSSPVISFQEMVRRLKRIERTGH